MADAERDTSEVTSRVELAVGASLTTVFVFGDFDLAVAAGFRRAIDAALAAPGGRIVVDLAGVDDIDSTGLGALVGAGVRAGEHAKSLVLRQPSRAARTLLAQTGLSTSFEYTLAG